MILQGGTQRDGVEKMERIMGGKRRGSDDLVLFWYSLHGYGKVFLLLDGSVVGQ